MKALDKPITLRKILELVSSFYLPDTWEKWDDIRPQSYQKIKLAFMEEDETQITAYAEHPILIPWYGCKVTGLDTLGDNTLRVWLDYENYLNHRKEWLRRKNENA